MAQPVNYKVKWTANQRLDLADLVDDRDALIRRFGSAVQGMSSYSSTNATGAKGQIFSGFTIAQGPTTYSAKITGEGMAVDADGNMLFKTATTDPFVSGLNAGVSTQYILHAYYQEQDSTSSARRFWNGTAEVSQTVSTRTESNFSIYVTQANPTANPVDSDGSGHPTIALWRISFDGSGNIVVLEDLRPRKLVLSTGIVPNGPLDADAFVMVQNVAAITSWSRSDGGTQDAMTVTPETVSSPSVVWMLDARYYEGAYNAAPACRIWTRQAGASGTMKEAGAFLNYGSSTGLTITGGEDDHIRIGADAWAADVEISATNKTTTIGGQVRMVGNITGGVTGATYYDIDHTSTTGVVRLGQTNADAVHIGKVGKNTTIKGNLIVDGALYGGMATAMLRAIAAGSVTVQPNAVGVTSATWSTNTMNVVLTESRVDANYSVAVTQLGGSTPYYYNINSQNPGTFVIRKYDLAGAAANFAADDYLSVIVAGQ